MAHKAGLKMIAESIETAMQRHLLTAAGCDYGQGYFFPRLSRRSNSTNPPRPQ
jgi:EAL domain-containing protein (putative c-di-GMP-specific phosphodiesterase class I)